MNSYMQTLKDRGVVVLPFPSNIKERFDLDKFLKGQVEFIDCSRDTTYVMGGFGAFGNPSSFHHPEVRSLRLSLFNHMKPIFATAYEDKYLQCIVDRFAVRRPGTSLSAESWHRDISNVTENNILVGLPSDIIIGGWVNLDSEHTQYFSCVPGSHNEPAPGGGFAKLSKKEAAKYKERRVKFAIPPGHMIMFNEKTVHEVIPVKMSTYSYRLFMKYRISDEDKPLFEETRIQDVIESQGIFPLSIVDTPPMYAKMHVACWGKRLNEFSANVKDEFLDKTCKQRRVKRYMPSLLEVGYDLFTAYENEEKEILMPQQLKKQRRI